MLADPGVTRFLGGRPLSQEEAWTKFVRNAGLWPLFGFGFWILEEKSTGSFAGEVGLAHFFRELTPPSENLRAVGPDSPHFRPGQRLCHRSHQRRPGLGASRFSDPRHHLPHPSGKNSSPSLRVAEKCGFQESSRATYKNEPAILLLRM